MDAVSIVALAAGAVGVVGGIVGVWVAMRTATRVAVKIVAATKSDGPSLDDVQRRVRLLEEWRWQTAKLETPPADPLPGDRPPGAEA
ncbi:hypothetical protein [Candidatus Poriferisodalis sp.]|uniref:hypothetical protein n=1 Tax=Candidatus Poriferisodalis sp. TaxID=3101277 RepID=UPI003B0287BC